MISPLLELLRGGRRSCTRRIGAPRKEKDSKDGERLEGHR